MVSPADAGRGGTPNTRYVRDPATGRWDRNPDYTGPDNPLNPGNPTEVPPPAGGAAPPEPATDGGTEPDVLDPLDEEYDPQTEEDDIDMRRVCGRFRAGGFCPSGLNCSSACSRGGAGTPETAVAPRGAAPALNDGGAPGNDRAGRTPPRELTAAEQEYLEVYNNPTDSSRHPANRQNAATGAQGNSAGSTAAPEGSAIPAAGPDPTSGGMDENGEEIWECPPTHILRRGTIPTCVRRVTPVPVNTSTPDPRTDGTPPREPAESSNCAGVCDGSYCLTLDNLDFCERCGCPSSSLNLQNLLDSILPPMAHAALIAGPATEGGSTPATPAPEPSGASGGGTAAPGGGVSTVGAVAAMAAPLIMSGIPNFQRIGVTAAAVPMLARIEPLQKAIVRIPDIGKGAILGGLAIWVGKSEKKWTEASEKLFERADKYNTLAEELENQTFGGPSTGCPEDEPDCEPCDPTKGDCPKKKKNDEGPDTPGGGGGGGLGGEEAGDSGSTEEADPETRTADARKKQSSAKSRAPGVKRSAASCSTGPQGSQSIDRSCSCRSSGSCTRSNLPRYSNFASAGLPSFTAASYGDLSRSSDALYNGDPFGSGDTAFANLNRNAARMEKLNKAVFDRLKKSVDGAEGPGTFDQYSENTMKGFGRAVRSSFGSLPLSSQAGMMGAIGGGGLGFGGGFDDDFGGGFDDGMRSEGVRLETGGGFNAAGGVPGFGDAADFGGEDFGAQSADVPIGDLGRYQSSENDISARPSVSIWKVISTRYIKSAVPVLLEKK